jgi:rRNA processing protein Krr1/Pno1
MALLIGPKGATLTALRGACGGARIDTPTRDSGDTKVTISGEEASVKYCKAQIRDLINKGYCAALSPGLVSSNMTVPGAALGILIGIKGANIAKVQDAFTVRIKTPERGSSSEQITISGLKENVRKAKATVQQIIAHGFSSVTHAGYEVGEVPFPRSELRHLIGPGGHTIKSIQGDTKTTVKIPAEDAENQNVQVIGPAEGVAKAIKQISTLLERKAAKDAAAANAAAYNSDDDA